MGEDNAAGMSADQVREYMRQLRSSPAEQVVSGILSELLEVARIKLGRRDARLFIDSGAVLLEQVKAYVSPEIAGEVGRALDELRFGQVQAERSRQADEPNDLPETPQPTTQTTTTTQPTSQDTPQPAQPPPSKLWIPGRDF